MHLIAQDECFRAARAIQDDSSGIHLVLLASQAGHGGSIMPL